jgi:hypothetical protein
MYQQARDDVPQRLVMNVMDVCEMEEDSSWRVLCHEALFPIRSAFGRAQKSPPKLVRLLLL